MNCTCCRQGSANRQNLTIAGRLLRGLGQAICENVHSTQAHCVFHGAKCRFCWSFSAQTFQQGSHAYAGIAAVFAVRCLSAVTKLFVYNGRRVTDFLMVRLESMHGSSLIWSRRTRTTKRYRFWGFWCVATETHPC